MASVYEKIIQLLDQQHVHYQTFQHEPVVTSEDAARVRGTDLTIGGKSLLFLADKKPVLIVLSGNKRVDFKKVKQALGVKDLRMANHDEVFKLTGCEVGGVPPMGVVFDIPTYLDQSFTDNQTMDFNAGERTRSIEMAVADYLTVVSPVIVAVTA